MTKTKRIKRIQLGWSCCNPDHFHHHKEVAERCIERYLEPRQVQRKWTPEMYADVIKRRESGETFKTIAARYGDLSVTRISQVYSKALRIVDWELRHDVARRQVVRHLQADTTASSSAV